VKSIAFDKTGTLTTGKISVTDVIFYNSAGDGIESEPSLHVTTSLFGKMLSAECRSSHPIAKGVAEYCSNRLGAEDSTRIVQESSTNKFEVTEGKGIKMTFISGDQTTAKETIIIGSARMMALNDVSIPEDVDGRSDLLRTTGKIVVYVAVNGVFSVLLGLGDEVRPEAEGVLEYFRSIGIDCHMVTGDNEITARAIAAQLNIPVTNIFAGASPSDKAEYILRLQDIAKQNSSNTPVNKVAFVGDGTNDAPALSKADVGFVMSGGTELALECGDIVLCKNTLDSLVIAIDLAKKTIKKIYANYFWALVYNSILVPIAAGVLIVPFNFKLNPMIAGGAMACSSVSVVVSSLFLSLYKPPTMSPSSTSIMSVLRPKGYLPLANSEEAEDTWSSRI
jgi:P-type Cu+ transporter